jgi:cytochrome c oxidase subunit I+III
LTAPPPSPLPNLLPRPPGELAALEAAWRAPRGWRLISSVNNTHVGLFYIGTALLFFVLAGVLALLMRAQLAVPGNTLLSEAAYNQVFTMHGTVMMFLFAVPVVEAIAVYLLPGMLGARDLPFPRLSAYAFWAYAIGGLAFFATIFFGVAPDGGWFMYPPLTGTAYSPGLGADFWLLGIGFIEISAIAGAIELIIGILMTRAPGMTLARMPVYAWAMLVVGFMIVLAFPAVIAGTALLEIERAFDWPFFIAARGGDPLLWQHLFWFFGHPEVYIIFLPAAGLVSMMVPVIARNALIGQRAVVASLIAVGAMSFALWLHHMFTAGFGLAAKLLVAAASMAIALPTGVQVFAWIGTLWKGTVTVNAVTLFLLGFLFVFVLGGLTGVMLAVVPFNEHAHDSYFIVAHLHYVLIGGVVFPMVAALYHWLPLVNGHVMSERVARWVFGLMFGGFNLAFFPMHIAGWMGMPRRVATYAADAGWNTPNLLSSIGAAVLALGILLLGIDLVRTLRRPEREHGNPWRAATLEWLPSENYGQRSIAQVTTSAQPLWDQPQLEQQVPAGRHWLPGTLTGGRETLITGAVHAQPRHLIVLPGDGWLPFVAALGTAGFFLLLTVKFTLTAWACGVIAIVATWWWLWGSDRPPVQRTATIGRTLDLPVGHDVEVPIGAQGARSHAWWAMVILLVVDASIFASFLFAHVHVAMRLDVCPPPGATLPSLLMQWSSLTPWLAGSIALALAARACARADSRVRSVAFAVIALLAVVAAGVTTLLLLAHEGVRPRADAWSATLAALWGYQALHAIVLVLMLAFVLARAACGLLYERARSSLDVTALMMWGSAAQAVVTLAVVAWIVR